MKSNVYSTPIMRITQPRDQCPFASNQKPMRLVFLNNPAPYPSYDTKKPVSMTLTGLA